MSEFWTLGDAVRAYKEGNREGWVTSTLAAAYMSRGASKDGPEAVKQKELVQRVWGFIVTVQSVIDAPRTWRELIEAKRKLTDFMAVPYATRLPPKDDGLNEAKNTNKIMACGHPAVYGCFSCGICGKTARNEAKAQAFEEAAKMVLDWRPKTDDSLRALAAALRASPQRQEKPCK